MKKIFALAAMAFTVAAATTAHAQEKKEKKSRSAVSYTSLGPVVGLGHSWVSGDLGGKKKFNFSPAVGIGLVYSKNEHWGFGGELMASWEGTKVGVEGTNDYDLSFHPLYLRMPLHVTYFFGKYGDDIRPKVYLGPTLGVKISEQYKDENGNSTSLSGDDAFFKSFDFGLNAGVGVNIKVATRTWLNLDAGYYAGLMNALKDADDTYRNNNLRLNVGLMFGL